MDSIFAAIIILLLIYRLLIIPINEALHFNSLWINTLDAMTLGALVTALATVVLAMANGIYLKRVGDQIKQNNKNINISKDKIVLEGYIKEMDSIVGPLWSKSEALRSYEPIHINNWESDWDKAEKFWELINGSKYLVPKALRSDLQIYMLAYKRQKDLLIEKRAQLRRVNSVRRETPLSPGFMMALPAVDISVYSPPVPLDSTGYLGYVERISHIIDNLENQSEIKIALTDYLKVIKEDEYIYTLVYNNKTIRTTITDVRQKLIDAINQRYADLEQWIENLRNEIENQ
jgi:hypothetical protein